MGWDGKERRRKKRYAYRDSLVRFKRAGILSPARGYSSRHLLLNFSEEGCHFITQEVLREGEKLVLRIEAPKRKGVTARGRVIWSRKSETLDASRVGIAFTKISEASRAALKNLLDSALLDHIDITTKVYLKEIERL